MEQLQQLKTMRDDAALRLEAARAAIEVSPDAKLFKSLSSLIVELEESLGDEAGVAPVKGKKTLNEPVAAVSNPVAEENVEAASTAPYSDSPDLNEPVSFDASELSLEESLEAELLADSNDLPNGRATSSY